MVLGISVVNGWFLVGELRGKRIQRRLDPPWFANIAQALAVGFFIAYQVVTQASFDLHHAVPSAARRWTPQPRVVVARAVRIASPNANR